LGLVLRSKIVVARQQKPQNPREKYFFTQSSFPQNASFIAYSIAKKTLSFNSFFRRKMQKSEQKKF